MSPIRRRFRPSLLSLAATVALVAACGSPDATSDADVTVYEGARLITGDGSAPIEDAVFVVEGDRFGAVGPRGSVDVPSGATRVDLAGKTVIPALVNSHIHLSLDRAEREDQLRHMAYYGAGTVVSLGLDEGEVPFELRDEPIPDGARTLIAGRGITSPEPGRSEIPHWVTTEQEARGAVRELAEQNVDLVKIWVDDRNGQYEKLSEPLYTAIIDEAHRHDLIVAAHIFALEDAKKLLRAGVDAFAHSIRDRDIDQELLDLWSQRPEAVLIPNLSSPGVVTDLSWVSTVPPDELAAMQERQTARPEAQEAFAIQARNLDRLNEAGRRIAFGTDGSTPWAVHLELEDMVRAGLTPSEALTAATRNSAALFQLSDIGTVAPTNVADFVVLDANPLDDITNTRRISDVYLRGAAIDREAMAARFRGEAMQ
ncbi:MAG: amidohydrolase family protein [Gemmatimonadota bacterium]|nr:amidohydrolase family protein [Gemmatimonadota bacterium]